MSAPRLRDARAVHIAADRRRPFALAHARTAEPEPDPAVMRFARWVAIGIVTGSLLTYLFTGSPW